MRLLEQLATLTNPKGWWTGQRPPRFYSYHPETFEYLGAGDCDPSPLEEGVWLQPGHSTHLSPPAANTSGLTLVFDPEHRSWHTETDRRGEVVYDGGEFRAIATLGEHASLKLEVHDAQYLLDEGDAGQLTRIRMWVNDDIIEFFDDPSTIQRRVLAEWEKLGEVIRPVDFDESQLETEAEMVARFDAEAAAAIEGKNQPEETP